MTEANKAVVRRLVEEVFSGGHLEQIDELYAPERLVPGRTVEHPASGKPAQHLSNGKGKD